MSGGLQACPWPYERVLLWAALKLTMGQIWPLGRGFDHPCRGWVFCIMFGAFLMSISWSWERNTTLLSSFLCLVCWIPSFAWFQRCLELLGQRWLCGLFVFLLSWWMGVSGGTLCIVMSKLLDSTRNHAILFWKNCMNAKLYTNKWPYVTFNCLYPLSFCPFTYLPP